MTVGSRQASSVTRPAIGAVVLAAGRSSRMGRPKPLLPWGDTTVIAHIVRVLEAAGIRETVVVTGAARELMESALADLPVRLAYNADYEQGGMLGSIQLGLRALGESCEAALIVPGDQPQIQTGVVQAVVEGYRATGSPVVAPGHQQRRGHPVLLAREVWADVLSLMAPKSLRDFLSSGVPTHFVEVATPAVLWDMDTPEDYERLRRLVDQGEE